MSSRLLFLLWFVPSVILLLVFGYIVVHVDPFFHYHAPLTDQYYYDLNSERYQNDGILRHFNYDAVIIGSSVTRNFRTSEADRLFGFHSVKTPFGGTTYKEVNDTLVRLFQHDKDIKTVIRGLDTTVTGFLKTGTGRDNLPLYLYNNNTLDDLQYILNRDVLFERAIPMILNRHHPDFEPGILSFDQYQYIQTPAGRNGITYDGVIPPAIPGNAVHLSEQEAEIVKQNITDNIVSVAVAHPDTDFYLYFTPYNILWWMQLVEDGTIYKEIEEQACAIETILGHDNIHLFSFNHRFDITSDMNHYFDGFHYAYWINSLILKWIHDGEYEITFDNYQDNLMRVLEYYLDYDYESLSQQVDYEDDFLAAALINEELTGAEPVVLSSDEVLQTAQFFVPESSGYRYLVFSVKKESGLGLPEVWAENDAGDCIAAFNSYRYDTDNEWHNYVMTLDDPEGSLQLFLGFDNASSFVFKDIILY